MSGFGRSTGAYKDQFKPADMTKRNCEIVYDIEFGAQVIWSCTSERYHPRAFSIDPDRYKASGADLIVIEKLAYGAQR